MTSTGNVRPGIWKTGTPPKKSENFLESSVADVTTRWKSRLLATTCMDWLVVLTGCLVATQLMPYP